MTDTIKLTVRQKIFLIRLVEFFTKTREPVHHTDLAKVLGLSKSTTYDMLKLLESKGWIYSVYAMPDAPRKQGRSKVMFLPTEWSIEEVFRPLGGEDAEGEQIKKFLILFLEKQRKNEFDKFYAGSSKDLRDLLSTVSREEPALAPKDGSQREADEWEELKEHIITTIRKQKKPDYTQLLREVLVLMEDTSSPLARPSEVILAILLNIRSTKYKFNGPNPLQMLLEAPVTKERMILLAGLAWGLLVPNPKAQQLLGDLGKNIQVYEESINKLSPEELLELHKFTREVWHSLDEHTKSAK